MIVTLHYKQKQRDMENVQETLKQLSFKDLEKLHSLLSDVALILNPEQEKLSALSVKGKTTSLTIELFTLDVFFEMANRRGV